MHKLVSGLSLSVLSCGSAFAALPTEVSSAMSDAKTDAIALAVLALLIVVGVAAIKYLKGAK